MFRDKVGTFGRDVYSAAPIRPADNIPWDILWADAVPDYDSFKYLRGP